MFLEEKYLLEILLNPGLNLTIFRETGPRLVRNITERNKDNIGTFKPLQNFCYILLVF